ncbi:hypothetical protein Q7P37_011611 [Cladosporium fusiforme]
MKTFTTTLLLAVGAASTAFAGHGHHARHQELHEDLRDDLTRKIYPAYAGKPQAPPEAASSSCGCYSYTTTWYGAPTLVPDLREYVNTTSAGWATRVPAPTGISKASEVTEATAVSEEPVLSTWVPRRKTSSEQSSESSSSEKPASYEAPPAYEKKASAASSYAPTTSEKKESSSYVQPSSYVKPSSTSTSSSAAPSSTSANNTITTNGNKWAFCYTPYAADGNCKSAEAVASDVASIKAKGFTTVRLYATDCEGPQNVGVAAAKEGLKLILGIWVDESGIGSNTDSQIDTLTKWGQDKWDMVEMVVAGNEAMFYGYTDAPGLASFVKDVRSKFRAAGFNGPVGTTEVPGTFTKYADTLCPAVDFAGANIHPFFNTEVSAEGAGDFVTEQLDNIKKACGGEKEAYNLESGWPSLGSANGMAVPGAEDQKIAIKSIMESAGDRTALFSYGNDDWKAPGEFGVEQHWGCGELFE